MPRIAIEHPVGIILTEIRPPNPIIQPWEHGHCETEATSPTSLMAEEPAAIDGDGHRGRTLPGNSQDAAFGEQVVATELCLPGDHRGHGVTMGLTLPLILG